MTQMKACSGLQTRITQKSVELITKSKNHNLKRKKNTNFVTEMLSFILLVYNYKLIFGKTSKFDY